MAAHQAPLSLGFSRQEPWSGLPCPSPMHDSEKWKWSHSVVSYASRPRGLQPTRLLHPLGSLGKSTGVGCHCLLRPAFLTVPNFRSMGKLMSTESVMLSNRFSQCCPFLLLSWIFPGTRKISWKTHSRLWEPKANQSYWPINLTWPWEICMQVNKQQNCTLKTRLVPNRERRMSSLHIVTLLI